MAVLRKFSCFLLLVMMPTCFTKSDGSPCKRSASDFNSCVADQMNSLRTVIKKGIPQLKVAPIDPMFVPKIRLRQGAGPVALDLTATNQTLRGISNYEITSANVDLEQYKMEFTATLPWLHVSGKSQMKGRVLVMPITGGGDGWSNYTMVHGKAVLTGHPTRKGDKEYFVLDSLKFDMSVKKATMFMDNMFNGNKQLGDALNKLMSENWELVFQELKPVINETVQQIIKDIAAKIFNGYSLDEMFPK